MTINEWREDFKSYINELDIPKDDYKGIMEYIDDAYFMLKEQETAYTGSCRVFQCKMCGYGIDDIFVNDEEKYQIIPRYCPNCGRIVKLE